MSELTGAPKTAAKKATDLGWTVQSSTAVVHVPEVLLAADGKTGQKGEVRTPAHDEIVVTVAAAHPKGSVGFCGTWTDGKFTDARIADPYGLPVENRADYAMNKIYAKTLGLKPAEIVALEARRDYDYNDESDRLERRRFTRKATELTAWLDGWLLIVNPSKAPKAKKAAVAVDEQERALEPIREGIWNG